MYQDVSQSDFLRNSVHKPVVEDPIFKKMHKNSSNLNEEIFFGVRKALENIHHKASAG